MDGVCVQVPHAWPQGERNEHFVLPSSCKETCGHAGGRNISRNSYEGPITTDPCDEDTLVPSNFSHVCTLTLAICLCGFAIL